MFSAQHNMTGSDVKLLGQHIKVVCGDKVVQRIRIRNRIEVTQQLCHNLLQHCQTCLTLPRADWMRAVIDDS